MKSLSASLSAGTALSVCLTAALALPTDPASLEFFEKEIRPLLANHCYECHSAQTATPFAGLRLDRREDLIKGDVSGPAVVPGKPDESPLIHRGPGTAGADAARRSAFGRADPVPHRMGEDGSPLDRSRGDFGGFERGIPSGSPESAATGPGNRSDPSPRRR